MYPAHIISCLKPTTAPKLTILHQTYNCSLLHQTHNGTEAHYTAPRLNVLATSSAASNLQLLRSSLYCTKAQCPCNCYASWSGRCSMSYLELMSYLINVVCSLLYIPQCPCHSKSLQQSGRTVIRNRTSNSTLANWLLFLN